jgi:hypothetical protein
MRVALSNGRNHKCGKDTTYSVPFNVIKLLYRLRKYSYVYYWLRFITLQWIQRVKYRFETNAFWDNNVINDCAIQIKRYFKARRQSWQTGQTKDEMMRLCAESVGVGAGSAPCHVNSDHVLHTIDLPPISSPDLTPISYCNV